MFYERLERETEKSQQGLFATPIIYEVLQGEVTLEQYLAFLQEAYHHVKHTVPLLMAMGSRLPDSLGFLQKAIAHYIEEEVGHEQWILNDIGAAGGNPEQVKSSFPGFATEMMVSYAYHQIDRKNPMGFFGMVYVLEGTSTKIACAAAEQIQCTLGLPDQALTYLNSHGALDLQHVDFFKNLMNQVTNEGDQKAIIHCVNRFYRLYGDIFRSLPNRSLLSVV
jgi:pyrroloquinoline quinone (PQQ) biosynthesis protein C